MKENRTKIIATIGPACEKKSVLLKMAQAGMDAIRLNFSHGNYRQFAKIIRNIRAIAKYLKKDIKIIQDLQGPKIRLGKISGSEIMVRPGMRVILGSKKIPIQSPSLWRFVKKGHRIFIEDGKIELHIQKVTAKKIVCRAMNAGVIKSFKGVNVPDTKIPTSILGKKDLQDLQFGIEQGVDYVGLSFVKQSGDIKKVRSLMKKITKIAPRLIAKIEHKEALVNLKAIIKVSDAVMVARGDLGVEVSPEMVPIYQKHIIHIAKQYHKPAIVATQMLTSMIEHPQPTRAEISDAVNALFDHADAFLLSNETAIGKYPVECIQILEKVLTAGERELRKHPHLHFIREKNPL